MKLTFVLFLLLSTTAVLWKVSPSRSTGSSIAPVIRPAGDGRPPSVDALIPEKIQAFFIETGDADIRGTLELDSSRELVKIDFELTVKVASKDLVVHYEYSVLRDLEDGIPVLLEFDDRMMYVFEPLGGASWQDVLVADGEGHGILLERLEGAPEEGPV